MADQTVAWHAVSPEDVLGRLGSTMTGLGDEEAAARLVRFGPNRLEAGTPVSWLRVLVAQLRGVVVWLLIAAGATAIVSGDHIEAVAIAVVLAINTGIGFVIELRARRAMSALLALDVPLALVVRAGVLRTIDAAEVVPGDVIELRAGHHVPADARVLAAHELTVEEAALTGESMPASKDAAPVAQATPLADRAAMVYKGTTVVSGTGSAIVTSTGTATEIGRIGVLVHRMVDEPTPLERRLDDLGRRLVWLTILVAAVVAALEAAHGARLHDVIETGIALAVAAVPEALPAVATIALAVGVRRMLRRHALVRRLPAVEALGSATVVCTDKTRTLTSGLMTVARLTTEEGDHDLRDETVTALPSDARELLEAALYASRPQAEAPGDGKTRISDPVDTAVVNASSRFGISRDALVASRPGVALVPFSSARQFMASIHRDRTAGFVAYVKGAPRQIVERCARTASGRALDEQGRRNLLRTNEALARAGFRVLAVAQSPVAAPAERSFSDLAFAGFLGLIDPPAPGVHDTIARLRAAGLRTVMLTGDQRLTAEAVGRELGLLSMDGPILTGVELDGMTAEALAARVGDVAAYSRVSPEHKLAIVTALQAHGEIVAMLGDGINDAAALRKADVGVAMGGRGTDVAKEAAAIVLKDDRFETIGAAVEEGRVIFDNIRKFVFYLFSCNLAEVLVLLVAGVVGLPQPLLPLQLLWLNIVTDTFPALALAMEPADPDVMQRPPRRPDQAILSRGFLASIGVHAALITGATLVPFFWVLQDGVAEAQTAAFMTLALSQVFHLGNARSREPVLGRGRVGSNGYAVAAVVLACALQLAAVTVAPVVVALHLAPLDSSQWAFVVAASFVPLGVGQVLRAWSRRRRAVLSAPSRLHTAG